MIKPADIHRKRKLLEQAEADIRMAIELSPVKDSPVYYGQLAHILSAQGRFEEAISLFQKAISLSEKVTVWDERLKKAAIADYFVSMGQVYARMGQEKLSKEYIDKGIKLAPTEEQRRVLKAIREGTFPPAKNIKELKRRLPAFTGKELPPMD